MVEGSPGVDSRRRAMLASTITLGATAVAGCAGVLDHGGDDSDDGSGDVDLSWTDWVPAAFLESGGVSEAARIDAERYREEFPAEMRASAELDDVEAQLGLEEGALDLLVQIDESITSGHVIFLGDVDRDDALDHLGPEASSRYEGYDVIGGSIALADGVIVASEDYRTVIDVQAGDGASLLEAGGEWPAVARNASDGAVGSVEAALDDPWEVEAIAASGTGGGEMRITAYAHFESAEAAEANVDEVRNREGGTVGETKGSLENVTVEGNVVVLEGTTPDYEF